MSEPDTFPASPAPTGPELRKASTLIGAGLAGGVSERLAMKTNQHTPGPWKFNGPGIYAPNFRGVASHHYDVAYALHVMDDEGEANARLIAAAPSLLEACKSALERIDGMNEAMGVVDELRRAITLAEGGTH